MTDQEKVTQTIARIAERVLTDIRLEASDLQLETELYQNWDNAELQDCLLAQVCRVLHDKRSAKNWP